MVPYLDHVIFGSHSGMINGLSLSFRTRIIFIIHLYNIYGNDRVCILSDDLVLGHTLDFLLLMNILDLIIFNIILTATTATALLRWWSLFGILDSL